MRTAKVNWEKIDSFPIADMNNYSSLEEKLQEIVDNSDSEILAKNGLYAIIADNKQPLYIGETHDQTIGERLQGKHDAYDDIFNNLNCYKYIYIIAGEIIPVSQGSVTETLIQDVEACLIYNLQPTYNIQNRERCKNPITVKNTGVITGACSC